MRRHLEFDALRGLLLVLMTLTHLPTRFSSYSSQAFGFVSAADGFVFLSAFLTGAIYAPKFAAGQRAAARTSLLLRARRLYLWHLGLLAFAFTVIAAIGFYGQRPALYGLLTFFFEQPMTALWAAPLLVYQPPLLDILPMYTVFVIATPWLLAGAQREGWRKLLVLSGLVWLFAQCGGRRLVLEGFNAATGIHVPTIPEHALGAFNWWAWQLLWVGGLWAGAANRDPSRQGQLRLTPAMRAAALVAALGFLAWYHDVGGFWPARADVETTLFGKAQLQPLRVLDFAMLAVSAAWLVPSLFRGLRCLALLGRASLSVFATHLLLVLLSLGIIAGDDEPLDSWQESLVLTATFGAMLATAWRHHLQRVRGRD
ncbi:MAG: OpgC domain-containing protein [Solimonas sp.]